MGMFWQNGKGAGALCISGIIPKRFLESAEQRRGKYLPWRWVSAQRRRAVKTAAHVATCER